MLNNVQRCFLFFAVFCILISAAAAAKETLYQPLIDPELLSAAGVKIVWENQLPLKPAKTKKFLWIFKGKTTPAENLDRLTILGNRLYALSDRNYLMSLNRNTGKMVFSKNVAPASFTVRGMDLYGNEIVSVIANRVVEIDPEFGTEKKVSEVPYGIVGTAARNSNYFYLAGTDKYLHVLRAHDKVPLFKIAARDDSSITSINAADDFVVFATDSGKVVAMTPDRPTKLWDFAAADGIAGQITRHNSAIFVASKDTNVYKIDGATGGLVWKYQSGAILEAEPLVTDSIVYQYLGEKGLAGIDAGRGKLVWQEPTGLDLLAEGNGKAYIITQDGKMVVMNNQTGKRLYTVNFAGVSVYATNLVDSNIYLSNAEGLAACIKPFE